jgi:hypothetical protein
MRNTKLRFLPLLLAVMAGCGSTDPVVTPPPPVDTTRPTVSSTVPASDAKAVAMNGSITATFSEPMTPGSISAATFTMNQGSFSIPGAVTFVGNVATLKPTSALSPSTTYSVTVSTGAMDMMGNAMNAPYNWSFTTGVAADTTAPTVSSTVPASNAVAVAFNSAVTATFSEGMTTASISATTFTLKVTSTGLAAAGNVSYTGLVATFEPTALLAASTTYTATITTGVKDLAGNGLAAERTWNFTTGAAADVTAPTVSAVAPASGATGAPITGSITATFSEAMATSSITNATFTLAQAGTEVPGTVLFTGSVATFKPGSDLLPSTPCTATISTAATDLAGNPLATAYSWSFTTGAAPDTTLPTVSSTIPANGATGALINGSISVTFSEAVNPTSITTTTFTLMQGTTPVTVSVSTSGAVATMTYTGNLASGTRYDVSIAGATDLSGNVLANTYAWSFTTAVAADTTPPLVSSTVPVANANGVDTAADISAVFNEAMLSTSITNASFKLTNGMMMDVPGTVGYTAASQAASFHPASALATSTSYTATISGGAAGVTDVAGNPLAADHTWNFITAAALDTTAPTVSMVSPINLASGVSVSGTASVTFSEAMKSSSISDLTFTLQQGTTPVPAAVTLAVNVATLTPTGALLAGTVYTATVSTGATDLAGNALAAPYTWSFTTASGTSVGIAAVDLRTITGFVILSKTGVTDVSPSAIRGDVGSSPITGAAIGLTMAEVSGSIYAVDAFGPSGSLNLPDLLTIAVADMELAYADAKGRINPDFNELGNGEIGSMTLTPGLYTWSSALNISTDVTLSGSATDVWIFQVAQTLDLAPAKMVTLAGGALAKNVFWQVAGAVTIGTTATMEGTILGFTSIAMNTGATLHGRAMAQTAVTLQQSTLALPAQ